MLLFELECLPCEAQKGAEPSEEGGDSKAERRREIRDLTMEYLLKNNMEWTIFVVSLGKCRCKLALIISAERAKEKKPEAVAAEFFLEVGVNADIKKICEITSEQMRNHIRRADNFDFFDEDAVPVPWLREWRRSWNISETLAAGGITRETIEKQVKELLMEQNLQPELARILRGADAQNIQGHPVHYCLVTDEPAVRQRTLQILLGALLKTGRVASRRCLSVRFENDDSDDKIENYFLMAYDGTLVVEFEEWSERESYAISPQEGFAAFFKIAAKHLQDVLLVLCFSKKEVRMKQRALEATEDTLFVEISEDNVDAAKARHFLRARAKEMGARETAALTAHVKTGETYSISDLTPMLNRWHSKFLRTEVYPQYKELELPQTEKRAPKGDAFKDLHGMIGLAGVKDVLDNVLQTHKMRYAYERWNIRPATPTMHMVFSGNPGTAKTTVARLFAQVMKDNGLLSEGKIFEIGRADLVGKYVGHTAPLVKNWFQRARGSVLFIDEAYALLDDRAGLYGDEAINTIVQEMERMRDEVMVIFAGYSGPMRAFLARNPGLQSRIAFHVDFPDYSPDELLDILALQLENQKLTMGEEARNQAKALIAEAKKHPDFGNGRYVRNLLEQARMRQARRLSACPGECSKGQIKQLEAADFVQVLPPEAQDTGKKVIGF